MHLREGKFLDEAPGKFCLPFKTMLPLTEVCSRHFVRMIRSACLCFFDPFTHSRIGLPVVNPTTEPRHLPASVVETFRRHQNLLIPPQKGLGIGDELNLLTQVHQFPVS